MRRRACGSPLGAELLTDYWLAELTPDAEAAVEEHLLSCDSCSDDLEWTIGLAQSIRTLARRGALRIVISQEFLQRLVQEGLRVRQYSLPAGGEVQCTVTPEDDVLVARLAADLGTARRIDLVQCDSSGHELLRLEDVPFHAQRGEIILSECVPHVRSSAFARDDAEVDVRR